jgi:hypothetical protein
MLKLRPPCLVFTRVVQERFTSAPILTAIVYDKNFIGIRFLRQVCIFKETW